MTLINDNGKSRIKRASMRRQRRGATQSAARPEPAQWHAIAAEHWAQLTAPQKIVIANVAGAELAETLTAWMQEHWLMQPHFVIAGDEAHGVSNGYCLPERHIE